jgi:4-hydroxyphenylacetate decarboxylase large subunit
MTSDMDLQRKKKLGEILAEKGLGMNFQYGGKAPDEIVDREYQDLKPHPRVEKLYDLYLNTLSSVNMEFGYWYNRTYAQYEYEIPVYRRAKALAVAFEKTTPLIVPGELIVGCKARYYRGSFPMPQLSEGFFLAHEDEMYQEALKRGGESSGELSRVGAGGGNVTESFGKIVSIAGKFGIRAEEVPALNKIAKAWYKKSVDDLGNRWERQVPDYDLKEKIMRTMICMFDSGYTLPQGREVMSYYYPLEYGFDGLLDICREKKAQVAGNADGDGIIGMDRLYFYESCIELIQGIQKWIENHAKEAARLKQYTTDAKLLADYDKIIECCSWIAHKQPRTFYEAIQMVQFMHTITLNEDALSGMSPGRLGQVLWPWYEQDIAAGRITEDEVLELLELQRVKFTCFDVFASFGVVGGVLSGNTFNNLAVGGLTRTGESAANRLEYLMIHAGMTMPCPQPTLSILWDEKTPEDFVLKCAECTKIGTGYPAWFSFRMGTEFIWNHYQNEGMTLEEARSYAIGGCLETAPSVWKVLHLNGKEYEVPAGASQPAAVGVHFISNPKILEMVLFNGFDQRTGIQVFEPHNKKLESFDEIWEIYKDYYAQTIEVLRKCNNIQHDIWRKNNMCIIQSLFKPDCLDKGHHIGNMGYRWNGTYNIESCGTINMVNSFAALDKLVFQDKKYTLDDFRKAIRDNFGFYKADEIDSFSLAEQVKKDDGEAYDAIHGDCLQAPKYGNDDINADKYLILWEKWFTKVAHTYESLFGLEMYTCQNSVSTHGTQGRACLATPDGRLYGTTFADGSMSAYPGTDRNGPYALFKSATCWDQSWSQNSQMNMKIHPLAIKGENGTRHLADLIKAYLRRGAHHIQFNVCDSKVMRQAQANPEQHRDLLVRVAGFTQYWVEIGKHIQDEVIARTEYESI